MADYTNVYMCRNFGDAWAQYIEFCRPAVFNSPFIDVITPAVLSSYEGKSAIFATSTDPSLLVTDVYYVMQDTPVGLNRQAIELLAQHGAVGNMLGTIASASPVDFSALFQTFVTVPKAQIIESLGVSDTAGTTATKAVTDAAATVSTVTYNGWTIISGKNYVVVAQDIGRVYFIDPTSTDDVQFVGLANLPNAASSLGIPGFNNLVRAVQDVADSDLEVSINHGQGAASVKGKTTT